MAGDGAALIHRSMKTLNVADPLILWQTTEGRTTSGFENHGMDGYKEHSVHRFVMPAKGGLLRMCLFQCFRQSDVFPVDFGSSLVCICTPHPFTNGTKH